MRARWAGATLRARAAFTVLVLLTIGAAPARDVAVSVVHEKDGCHVRGSFLAPVSAAAAWSVLSDYDSIPRFVRSMRSSRVESRENGRLRVRQHAVGNVFLFRRHVQVLLEVREDAGRRIQFHDTLGKDFSRYVGEWRIAADSGRTRVEYELEAEPRTALPAALTCGAMRRTAQGLLDQVRGEMLRRAGAAR